MALIFSAFHLKGHPPAAAVSRRFEAIEAHYLPTEVKGVKRVHFYDQKTGVGFHCLWQQYDNENLRYVVETDGRIVAFTNLPFGYSSVLGSVPVGEIGPRMADDFRKDPAAIGQLHPPFSLVDVDKATGEIRYYGDSIGLSKSFNIIAPDAAVLTNRFVSGHWVALLPPKPCEIGWAADQMVGWLYDDLTPFHHAKRNKRGALIKIDSSGCAIAHQDIISRWFTQGLPTSVHDAYDRMAAELKAFGNYGATKAALSGGRDSRATAAAATRIVPEGLTFRTNYPPVMEKTIASRLMENLDRFSHFQADDIAIAKGGSFLWRGSPRRGVVKGNTLKRGAAWVHWLEGQCRGQSLRFDCAGSVFDESAVMTLNIHGVAGEVARAYKWFPPKLKHADTRAILRYIAKTPIDKRIGTHRLTSRSKLDFAHDAYWPMVQERVDREMAVAKSAGITGYRFFDYWYIVARLSKAGCGYAHDSGLMPFLAPEYLSAAVRQTPARKVEASLPREIVAHYQPKWAKIPYMDQVKDAAEEDLTQFSDEEYLWQGDSRASFFEVLEGSPAFDRPFNREKMLEHFNGIGDQTPAMQRLSHMKAYGLVHRHVFGEFCDQIGKQIAAVGS